MSTTLMRGRHPMADPALQRSQLAALGPDYQFSTKLCDQGLWPLEPIGVETLQINVGKVCNQTCAHCHVDAGPDRKEIMPDNVVEACLHLLHETAIATLDITGGAPELHPRFRDIVARAAHMGRRVIHRCNLTVIRLERFSDIPELLACHGVEIVASLPHPAASLTDRQRGTGVFEQSIEALKHLNSLGYGQPGTGLILDLVTNPVGAFLPGGQEDLEQDWRRTLRRNHGIEFSQLYTITNMPISRFLEYLVRSENLTPYMRRLAQSYNPAAAERVMCRNMLSVAWDGTLFDCDFNQMLDIPIDGDQRRPSILGRHPRAIMEECTTRKIRVGAHCFACTAGAGSSCTGTVT